MAGLIGAPQYVSGTITLGNTSNTITITSVTTADTIVFFNGISGFAGTPGNDCVRWELTNATTITITRGSGAASSITVNLIVATFTPGFIVSKEATQCTPTAGSSATDSITSVNTARAIIVPQGASGTSTSSSSTSGCAGLAVVWALNSATQTQATVGSEWGSGTVTCNALVVVTA